MLCLLKVKSYMYVSNCVYSVLLSNKSTFIMRMMKHKIIIIPHQDSNSGPNHLSLLEFKMGHRPLSHHDPICLNFFDFSSFFTKTMKKLILTSIWQHPNAGRNIQKLVLC